MNTLTANAAPVPDKAPRMLTFATFTWTCCFAAWTIFSIIGVRLQRDLGLSESEFALLISAPILTGSIARLFLGIASERYGGRLLTTLMMLASAAAMWLLTFAETYSAFLLAALGVGLAGGVFITGISFVSGWFPQRLHGSAFGLFGLGNLGAAITNFGAPLLLVALGWQATAGVYAAVLAAVAILFWLASAEDPATLGRRAGANRLSLADQVRPLRYLRVWRFGLYYFFVFGAFVALASWLPRYYIGVYDLSITQAGLLTAVFSLSAAVFRAFGGWLSDRWGPRRVMYWTFSGSLLCLLMISYPSTTYIIDGIEGPITFTIRTTMIPFTVVTFVLGFFMAIGMAAVYKNIPAYYPHNVGTVGGLVGMIGGLGGFFLPVVFGVLNQLTGIWTTAFMALFGLVLVNLLWMHHAIQRMQERIHPDLAGPQYLPEAVPEDALETIQHKKG